MGFGRIGLRLVLPEVEPLSQTLLLVLYLVGLVVILTAVYFLPVKFNFKYRYQNGTQDLEVKVTTFYDLLGLRRKIPLRMRKEQSFTLPWPFKGRIPLFEAEPGPVPAYGRLKHGLKTLAFAVEWVRDNRRLIKYFLTRLSWRYLRWETRLGLGEAGRTGPAAGAAWAVKGMVIGFLKQNRLIPARRDSTLIRVIPEFNTRDLSIDLHCIFEVRTGHIMIVMLRFLVSLPRQYLWLKTRRWRDGARAPNPGIDEDRHGEHQRNGGRQYRRRRPG